MIPNVEETVLTSEFSLKNAPPPKPEAPWIKRCDFGIKFTDEIQIIESRDDEGITETEMSTNKDEDHNGDYDNQEDNEDEDSSHNNNYN